MADVETPDLAYAATLSPEAAIRYFESKGQRISWDWHDTLAEANARAFTAAHVARADVLRDLNEAVRQALREGRTDQWFENDLTAVLQDKGWWGTQLAVADGQAQRIQLGSPQRLRLIYRQNLQDAYQAGRYTDFIRNARERPYWMYVAVMDSRTRPSHAAMHGRVFHYTDPIWNTHWPPCGWNCRCRVRALSQRQLDAMGLKVESSAGLLSTKMVTDGLDAQTGELRQTEVTGIRLIGPDGKPVTFYPDAGFNYNSAQAAYRPDLDAYPNDVARAYVDGVVTGPEFARWFGIWQKTVSDLVAGKTNKEARALVSDLARNRPNVQAAYREAGVGSLPSGIEYPLAVLQPADQAALRTSSQTVWFSTGSLIEHLGAHPEIGIADYALMRQMLASGEVYQDGDQRIILLANAGSTYKAVIKVDANHQRLYLQTLFKVSPQAAAAVRTLERVR